MSTNSTYEHRFVSGDLSAETTTTILTVNLVALVGAISFFGIVSNVINILVFCKQGFAETTNISYTALAISDLLSLVFSFFLSILWNPWFLNSGLPLAFADIQAPLATMPIGYFSRITGLVTAFITLERCLCVVWPLRVKKIFTWTSTTVFSVSIYLTMCLTMVPIYSILLLGWRFDRRTNRTLLGVISFKDPELPSAIFYTFQSVSQFFAFLAVVVCTVTLIVCLKQKSNWRTQQTQVQNATKMMTKRQEKAIKMVMMIAIIYIICYLPTITVFAATVLYIEFSPIGRYKNIFLATWSTLVLCGVLNSSVSLLVYYHMSSKFKQTCDQILSRFFKSKMIKERYNNVD